MCTPTLSKSVKNASSLNGSESEGSGNKETTIPSMLQFWRRLYQKTRPLFPYDVSLTVLTVLLLGSMRFGITWYLHVAHGWPLDEIDNDTGKHLTKEAAASLVAVFHSMLLVPGLIACFLSYPYNPSERLDAAPVWWQESVHALLQFCTGYMIYDGILNILVLHYPNYEPSDWMFLGHHMATTIYMASTRVLGAGHMSAMMCMFLGESTNPLQNFHGTAQHALKLACCNGGRMQWAHDAIEFVFCLCYVVIRALVGPLICLHMTVKLIKGKEIPMPLKVLWITLIWAVLIGSIPWIQDCLTVLQRYGVGQISSEL